MNHSLTWFISAVTILLILARPRCIPEALWACAGAGLLLLFQLVPLKSALVAVGRGTDVYLFLMGMMLLAEIARLEGVFDWIAVIAVRSAGGSGKRLFAWVYLVGIGVTTFLSNDATAVVLTPAVFAAVKKARATPLPYLLSCAFVANAASFVLPIANPANLLVYASRMPPLATWLRIFGLPSVLSISATYVVLRFSVRKGLAGDVESDVDPHELSPAGRRAAYGIVGTSFALILASTLNLDLGLPTFLAAAAATVLVALKDPRAPRAIIKEVSWSVLPLVAGLFVIVEALNGNGALAFSQAALQRVATFPPLIGALASGVGVALLSNIMNNLPVGLITSGAIHSARVSEALRSALLIGVDLGPNLSITGSLATILWLVALRREGEDVSFWRFLKYGALVMPPALMLAILAMLFTQGGS